MKSWILFIAVLALAFPALSQAEEALTVVGEEVALKAEDGAMIYGTFYQAEGRAPAVILLHMMRRDRKDWENFAFDLNKAGFSALSIDLRGHGQSTKREDGALMSLEDFSNQDFQNMQFDLAAALKYLQGQKVNKNKIAIIGASIGANTALNYAARHPDRIKAVGMLSPGLQYRSVDTLAPMGKFKGPVFLAAGKDDQYAAESVLQLNKILSDRCKTMIFKNSKHGTNLFVGDNTLSPALIDWLNLSLK